jgi:glycosyltransferase involved in cell wall biosynthesis
MKALAAQGYAVTFVTEDLIDDDASEWLTGVNVMSLSAPSRGSGVDTRSWPKRRLANYWGCQHSNSERLAAIVQHENVDVLVAVGIETLPCLEIDLPIKRIWYPADDPALHAFTLMRREGFTFRRIHQTTINIAYQRAFRRSVDAVWVVSSRDQKWMRRTAGFRTVDVIPNGVDADHYRPGTESVESNTCIFWGRLDFPPNIHALEYFLNEIWPHVRIESPKAKFHVCGAHPTAAIRTRLLSAEGVCFHENLDDIRPRIARSCVAVFPMVSGAGVKNKVLEAAAMAKPVLATELCLGGLSQAVPPPFELLGKPKEWVSALIGLWSNSSKVASAGDAVRDWVTRHHSWDHSASEAIRSLKGSFSHDQAVPTKIELESNKRS